MEAITGGLVASSRSIIASNNTNAICLVSQIHVLSQSPIHLLDVVLLQGFLFYVVLYSEYF